MSETVGPALFLSKTTENGSMPPSRAKRIIKAHLMEHPAIKFSYDTLRPLVPGCVGKRFTNVMTEIKLMPDFNGGYATAEYSGPRRELLPLPDCVRGDTDEAEVYLGIKGGNNTLDGLKHKFGSDVAKVVYRLKRKDVIRRNEKGGYETNEAMPGQNGINGRAQAGVVTSALLDYLQENAIEQPIPNAQIVGALTQRGLNKGSINARLAEFKKNGLTTGEIGMSMYVGEHGKWWNSVHETQTPEGDTIRYMERALEGLPDEDERFVRAYLIRAVCNPQTYDAAEDTYKPRNPDFRRAATISDAVIKFRGEDGVPPELYLALRLLPPEDYRTAIVFGELLIKSRAGEDWRGILRDISSQTNTEAAYHTAGKHGIYFPPHANNLSYSRH